LTLSQAKVEPGVFGFSFQLMNNSNAIVSHHVLTNLILVKHTFRNEFYPSDVENQLSTGPLSGNSGTVFLFFSKFMLVIVYLRMETSLVLPT